MAKIPTLRARAKENHQLNHGGSSQRLRINDKTTLVPVVVLGRTVKDFYKCKYSLYENEHGNCTSIQEKITLSDSQSIDK